MFLFLGFRKEIVFEWKTRKNRNFLNTKNTQKYVNKAKATKFSFFLCKNPNFCELKNVFLEIIAHKKVVENVYLKKIFKFWVHLRVLIFGYESGYLFLSKSVPYPSSASSYSVWTLFCLNTTVSLFLVTVDHHMKLPAIKITWFSDDQGMFRRSWVLYVQRERDTSKGPPLHGSVVFISSCPFISPSIRVRWCHVLCSSSHPETFLSNWKHLLFRKKL